MIIKKVTYLALGAFVCAASCSKEAAEPDVYDWADGKIYFRPSISNVIGSRAQDMTLDRLESFQVTCFNTADIYTDQAGHLYPYFENAKFIRKANSYPSTSYVTPPDEVPWGWPSNDGFLRFFAFSPSPDVMADGNPAPEGSDKTYFNLINNTYRNGSSVSVDYRLGFVRINPDISRQFDFVTAEASGTRWNDFMGGVDLAFSHQLCQVELKAWGASEDYNFDIAGVRIGNPVVEGTFIFADDADKASAKKWETVNEPVKDKVEYIFRSAETHATLDEQYGSDKIIRINSREHNTLESAVSIMGKGGCAMVIPTFNTKWKGLEDPNIGNKPYTTDRMYFSILIRVTDPSTGNVVYPYPGNQNNMTVISYVVDKDGNIIKRLYPGETSGTYFNDPELKSPYVAPEGEKEGIMDFGWAAVPVDADWSAGKKYVYTLNYSEGIGIHDPSDPEPGKLIVGERPIEWSVSISKWEYAEKDENYDPDLDVPGFDE